MEYRPGAPLPRARHALLTALAQVAPGVQFELGKVEPMGRGLSRDGFVAYVEVDPDPQQLAGPYIALLAHGDADEEYAARVRREARVLEWVWPRIRGIQVPRALALVDDEQAPILVTSFVAGLVVDLRVGRLPIVPWEVVAEAAAAVHAVEQPPAEVLPARDRRQHRADTIRELFEGRELEGGLLRDAHAWMREHVDRPGAGALLHGDLLGQNLRVGLDGEPNGVIDWEYAELGDPAYDLAIVTRGARQPFQAAGGRARLLEAYNTRAGHEVTRDDLRFFELALHVRWFADRPERRENSRGSLTWLLATG